MTPPSNSPPTNSPPSNSPPAGGDPSSRHTGADAYRVSPEVELLVPRMRTRPPAARRHIAQVTDRLDILAAAYLGDPHLYWRIADANPSVPPDQLVEPGRSVDIPGSP